MPEHIFSKSLEVYKKRKKTDLVAAASVRGTEISNDKSSNFKDYYLTKLPTNDPRAYILGHFTDCCQSIGSNAEKCVIDGITKENNGFYVLLKTKKKNTKQPAILNSGQLNHKHYRIVGQGYCWNTDGGDLVFDSWENLRLLPGADKAITLMLPILAKKLVDANPQMLTVRIGTGGNTPATLKSNRILSEQPKQGYQYPDSYNQSLLYLDKKKLTKIKEQLQANWQQLKEKPFFDDFNELYDFIELDKLSSLSYLPLIKALFFSENSAIFWEKTISPTFKNRFIQIIKSKDCTYNIWVLLSKIKHLELTSDANAILLLAERDSSYFSSANRLIDTMSNDPSLLSKEQTLMALKEEEQTINQIIEILRLLTEAKLLKPDYKSKLLMFAKHSLWDLHYTLNLLDKHNVLSKYIDWVFSLNHDNLHDFLFALICLNSAQITDEYIDEIIKLKGDRKLYAEALVALKKGQLFEENSWNNILTKAPHSLHVINCLNDANVLNKAFLDLFLGTFMFNQSRKQIRENANTLETLQSGGITSVQDLEVIFKSNHPNKLGASYKRLKGAGLLTEENKQILQSNLKHCQELAEALEILNTNNILNKANQTELINDPEHCLEIADALSYLKKYQLIDNVSVKKEVLQDHNYSNAIAYIYGILHKLNMLTSSARATILHKKSQLMVLAQGIGELYKANLQDVKHCKLLLDNIEHSYKLGIAINHLAEAKQLCDNVYPIILNHKQYANAVADGIIYLSKANLEDEKCSILKQPQYSHKLGYGLKKLKENKLLTPENKKLLMKQPQFADVLANTIIDLSAHKITGKELKQFVFRHANQYDWFYLVSNFQHLKEQLGSLSDAILIGLLETNVSKAKDISQSICKLCQISKTSELKAGLFGNKSANNEMNILVKSVLNAVVNKQPLHLTPLQKNKYKDICFLINELVNLNLLELKIDAKLDCSQNNRP